MGYIVNNIAVGNDPQDIKRSDSYNNFFETVGSSSNNIKVIPNFLSDEEIKHLMNSLEKAPMLSFASQKDDKGEALNWMHMHTNIFDKFKIIGKIKEELIKAYGFTNIVEKEPRLLKVVKWEKGSRLNLHVDDLGYITDNEIATLVYLNDDYEGGEISFETHGISMKPKIGDLLFFPGNLHYPHEVKEVLSGTRYTLPVWFTIV